MEMEDESIPTTSRSEVEGLIRQLRASSLDPAAKDKIERLLRTILSMVLLLEKKNTSIAKLKKLIIGKKSERDTDSKKSQSGKSTDGEAGETEDPATGEKGLHQECETKVKSKGHGHRPLSDYTGVTVVECSNKDLRPGDSCPECIGNGRLYDLDEPTALLQFRSEPLINATIYRRKVLRCSSCQQRYEAPLDGRSRTNVLDEGGGGPAFVGRAGFLVSRKDAKTQRGEGGLAFSRGIQIHSALRDC